MFIRLNVEFGDGGRGSYNLVPYMAPHGRGQSERYHGGQDQGTIEDLEERWRSGLREYQEGGYKLFAARIPTPGDPESMKPAMVDMRNVRNFEVSIIR